MVLLLNMLKINEAGKFDHDQWAGPYAMVSSNCFFETCKNG